MWVLRFELRSSGRATVLLTALPTLQPIAEWILNNLGTRPPVTVLYQMIFYSRDPAFAKVRESPELYGAVILMKIDDV